MKEIRIPDTGDRLVLRRKPHRQDGRPVIRVSAETYQALVDLSEDTGIAISSIASKMIAFAAERTVLEARRKEE